MTSHTHISHLKYYTSHITSHTLTLISDLSDPSFLGREFIVKVKEVKRRRREFVEAGREEGGLEGREGRFKGGLYERERFVFQTESFVCP